MENFYLPPTYSYPNSLFDKVGVFLVVALRIYGDKCRERVSRKMLNAHKGACLGYCKLEFVKMFSNNN